MINLKKKKSHYVEQLCEQTTFIEKWALAALLCLPVLAMLLLEINKWFWIDETFFCLEIWVTDNYLFCYRHCDIPQENAEHKAKFRLGAASNEASHQSPELPSNTSRAKLACDM